jgi:protoheme IX farnesyltransferase
MKVATSVCPEASTLTLPGPPLCGGIQEGVTAYGARTRVADYVELTKPRVAVLVLFTVAAGSMLAAGGYPDLSVLFHTLFGTALVAAGASALNQFLERDSDMLMRRTESRPLPAGRLQPIEVLGFGLSLGIVGVLYLAVFLNQPLAALVAALTFVSYVFVYTPLKRKTTLNTLIGAVPGALPPLIGWTAVRGSPDLEMMPLFVILFLWQVPHFLAIAWIHREDYGRAGLRMLPVVDPEGKLCAWQMLGYCLALVPASLAPMILGRAGPIYLVGALLLGLGFLAFAVAFARARSSGAARAVLRASLVYLPTLLALLLLDGVYR